MPRLGRNRVARLAGFVCGDDASAPFPYRRHVDLDDLFDDFALALPGWESEDGYRSQRAFDFVNECNRTDPGVSGFPEEIESLVFRLLDIGEFDSVEKRDEAVEEIRKLLDGYGVELRPKEFSFELVPDKHDARQAAVEQTLLTVFDSEVDDTELDVARIHFRKAKHLMLLDQPDYENSVKESVGSVESLLKTLTGEKDFAKALRVASGVGIPKPLTELVKKFYAWRGDEPGVGHAGTRAPTVTRADAQFAYNQAAVINSYLRERLVVTDRRAGDVKARSS